MKLDFGKYKGMEVGEVPFEYLSWLASNNTRQEIRPNPEFNFKVPADIEAEAKELYEKKHKEAHYVKWRLNGLASEETEYLVEGKGDIGGQAIFPTLEDALRYTKETYGYPDPEDDRILIWEILPSGHKKVVWHFSGWHWDSEEFPDLEQGAYLGEDKDVYGKCMEDY